jgi:hypothetical protein
MATKLPDVARMDPARCVARNHIVFRITGFLDVQPGDQGVNVTGFKTSHTDVKAQIINSHQRLKFLGTYARFCAGVMCSNLTQGTRCISVNLAAATRPCPAKILLSASIKTGLVNPNVAMHSPIWRSCFFECVLAFFAQDFSSPMAISSIV